MHLSHPLWLNDQPPQHLVATGVILGRQLRALCCFLPSLMLPLGFPSATDMQGPRAALGASYGLGSLLQRRLGLVHFEAIAGDSTQYSHVYATQTEQPSKGKGGAIKSMAISMPQHSKTKGWVKGKKPRGLYRSVRLAGSQMLGISLLQPARVTEKRDMQVSHPPQADDDVGRP